MNIAQTVKLLHAGDDGFEGIDDKVEMALSVSLLNIFGKFLYNIREIPGIVVHNQKSVVVDVDNLFSE